jgi:predicted alpha/beta superfamily hydrolase
MKRNVLVWLPPGYEVMAAAGHRFSVLYLMDGQNVFDAPPGVPGEWRADETATALVTSGRIEPVVIVGVPNAGRYRGDEYLPFGSVPGMEPAPDEFLDWIERVVIPGVEGVASVRDDAAGRAIGGASLGGAISLYAATTRPGVYSKAIVESLPMLGQHSAEGDGPARAFLDSVTSWPARVFVGMGGCEVRAGEPEHPRNAAYRAWAADLGRRMREAGLGEDRARVVVEAGATHTEAAWAERLPGALEFLFAPATE